MDAAPMAPSMGEPALLFTMVACGESMGFQSMSCEAAPSLTTVCPSTFLASNCDAVGVASVTTQTPLFSVLVMSYTAT